MPDGLLPSPDGASPAAEQDREGGPEPGVRRQRASRSKNRRGRKVVRLPKTANASPRSPLKAWHAKFGLWLVGHPATPSIEEMREVAATFANAKQDPRLPPIVITTRMLRTLRERADFQLFVKQVERGHLERARAMFEAGATEVVDSYFWALTTAREQGDYKAASHTAIAGLDRIVPKKDDRPPERPIITIQLGTFAQRYIDAPRQDCEVEELSVEAEPTVDKPETDRLSPQRGLPPAPRTREGEIVIPLGGIVHGG